MRFPTPDIPMPRQTVTLGALFHVVDSENYPLTLTLPYCPLYYATKIYLMAAHSLIPLNADSDCKPI